MVGEVNMPLAVQKALTDRGINVDSIIACAKSDLDPKGDFCTTWLCADQDHLYVCTQVRRKNPLPRLLKVRSEKKDKAFDTEFDWRNVTDEVELSAQYELANLSELKCEYFVGSLAVTAKLNDQTIVICRGSKSNGAELNAFCRRVNNRGKEEKEHAFFEQHMNNRCPKCSRLYPDPNRMVCPNCIDKRTLFRRVLALTPKYKGPIITMILIMFVSSLVSLAPPYLTGHILIDETLNPNGKYAGMVGPVILISVLTSVVSLLLSIAHGRINSGVTAEIVYDLKKMIFSAMQRLSLSFYNKRQTGSLMNRVNNDATDLQYFFHDGLPYLIVNSVKLVGIAILLLKMNWQLTLLVFIPIPLILLFIYKVLPHLWKLHSRRFRTNAALNSVINDSLTGIRVVKAFGKEDEEVRRFSVRNAAVFDVQMSIGKLSSTLFPLMDYIMGLGTLIVWGVGGWHVVSGRMQVGVLITFTGYLGMLYDPIRGLTEIVDWWSYCMNSAQRIFEIVDSTECLPYPQKPVKMPHIKGEVVARDVEFAYEEGRPILQDINFEVKPGEMIGLVGHSGAGKSTMINLISRLYDVNSGAILIDGVNIKDIAKEDLHQQIGMVLQETFLFRGTIMENIAYAKPDATEAEIIRAAKIANAHDFIMRLPDGYDTVIGRKGHDLSGGEKQRLAIARAVLLDPRILILDEATANIDTETEQLIQEALEQLIQGRTTFAIAHRLSTLRRADRLFVFEHGRIVEVGTHEELLAKKGVYEKLFTTQQKALELTAVGG